MNCVKLYNAFSTIVIREIVRINRIWAQTLLPPAIMMSLYYLIFGTFIGSQVDDISGYSYMAFIVPGIVMMSVITNSYMNVVSSFFSTKFIKNVEELLVSPTPPWVIVTGYVIGGMYRSLLVGLIVLGISLFFTQLEIHSALFILLYILLTSLVFSLAGFTNAVFAKKFDDISIVPTFILTPLTYLGGVFYPLSALPEFWKVLSLFNPIVYMVDGFRFGFLGIHDISVWVGLIMLSIVTVILYVVNIYMIKKGVGLRS